MKSLTALIAVKKESTRVPNKNFRPFADTTLLDLKLDQLLPLVGDGTLNGIVVSTDSEEALERVSKRPGCVVGHKRPDEFCSNTIPMSMVYSYLAKSGGITYSFPMMSRDIIWVQVTNPLVDTGVYRAAIQTYLAFDKAYDCVLSMSPVQEYLFHKGKPLNFKRSPWGRSQDLTDVYAFNLAFSVLSRANMEKWGSLVGKGPYFYHLDRLTGWDIDWPEDFDFCEMMYKRRQGG